MELPEIEKVFFVHYGCQRWEEGNAVYNLSIYSLKHGGHLFDTEKEEARIEQFAQKVKDFQNEGLTVVHWDQDKPHFGWQHLNKRYHQLTDKALNLDYGNHINLGWELVKIYGQEYVANPRLNTLAELNSFSGSTENRSAVHDSDRVLLISKIYHAQKRGTLKTSNPLNSPKEKWQELKSSLLEYGFDKLDKIKDLKDRKINEIIRSISESEGVLQKTAWIFFLEFHTYLKKNHFRKDGEIQNKLAEILHEGVGKDQIRKGLKSCQGDGKYINDNAFKYLDEVKETYSKIALAN